MEQNLYYNFQTNKLTGLDYAYLHLFKLNKTLDADGIRTAGIGTIIRVISGNTGANVELRVSTLYLKYNAYYNVVQFQIDNTSNVGTNTIVCYEESDSYNFYLKTNLSYDSGQIQLLHLNEIEGTLEFIPDIPQVTTPTGTSFSLTQKLTYKLANNIWITGDSSYNALINMQSSNGTNPMSIGVSSGDMTFNSSSGTVRFNLYGNSTKQVVPNGHQYLDFGCSTNSWSRVYNAVNILTTLSTPPTAVCGGIYFDGTNFKVCKDGSTWTTLI